MSLNLDLAASLGMSPVLLAVVMVWSLIWMGIAMWKSARKNHIIWFVVFLLVHTLGILEILYIFVFSKMKLGAKEELAVKKKRR
ncbi:MAG: hypothetical protein KKB21_00580 [Nanoarchaeota archaeon]|nr:hypothetical protein [Nanoarchaeota archaeon]MBU4086050.1 hypothetical protein [Nanoarchaeota archaeon]